MVKRAWHHQGDERQLALLNPAGQGKALLHACSSRQQQHRTVFSYSRTTGMPKPAPWPVLERIQTSKRRPGHVRLEQAVLRPPDGVTLQELPLEHGRGATAVAAAPARYGEAAARGVTEPLPPPSASAGGEVVAGPSGHSSLARARPPYQRRREGGGGTSGGKALLLSGRAGTITLHLPSLDPTGLVAYALLQDHPPGRPEPAPPNQLQEGQASVAAADGDVQGRGLAAEGDKKPQAGAAPGSGSDTAKPSSTAIVLCSPSAERFAAVVSEIETAFEGVSQGFMVSLTVKVRWGCPSRGWREQSVVLAGSRQSPGRPVDHDGKLHCVAAFDWSVVAPAL
jgi:hypothetical protein